MSLKITHDAGASRFLAPLAGDTSYLSYLALDAETLDFRSTFVPEEHRGKGVGSKLVEHALRFARERGLKVVPTCPFVARTVERKPEFRDLSRRSVFR